MKKLVQGIIEFQKSKRQDYATTFARLALAQKPDCLFIACSDSRVAANVFASTEPGDLFVIRNVGNLIPRCNNQGHSTSDESEGAAIEFAISNLNVSDIIVCGHSECGAMQAISQGRENVTTPNLKSWLRHGEKALTKLNRSKRFSAELPFHNRLSQMNVLQQLENLKTYPIIKEKLESKKIKLHAWWFELAKAQVHYFDSTEKKFVEMNEKRADAILEASEE